MAGTRAQELCGRLRLAVFAVAVLLLFFGTGTAHARPNPRRLLSETPIVDDFNRPNETLSDGGNWSQNVGGTSESGLNVTSNQLSFRYSSTGTAWRNDRRYGPDTEVAVTIATKPGTNNAVRLYARVETPGSTSVDAYWIRYQDNVGTDQVFIERIDAGVLTPLATLYQEFSAGDKLKMRVIGTTIEAWRYDGSSWSKLGETPDPMHLYTGAGYVGVGLRGTIGRLDDFSAASLSPPPIPDSAPVMDNFNRANETLSDGGQWFNGVAGGDTGLKVVSNQLGSSNTATANAWRSNTQYATDQYACVTIATKPGVGNAVRLYARLQEPGTNTYSGYMLMFVHSANTDQIFLERIDSGSLTPLKSVDEEVAAGDELKLRAVGTSIQAWRYNGTTWKELTETNDPLYTEPGHIGVGLRGQTGRLDDFRGGSLPVNVYIPAIHGLLNKGEMLTADFGTWSPTPSSESIQWQRCAPDGAHCADREGAHVATYHLLDDDVGQTLRVEVTASNAYGSTTVYSLPTSVVIDQTALQALSDQFRPALLFDSSEHYRPISVESLLREKLSGSSTPAHKLCYLNPWTLPATLECLGPVDSLDDSSHGLLQSLPDPMDEPPRLSIWNGGEGESEYYYSPSCPDSNPSFSPYADLRDCGDGPAIYYDFGQSSNGVRYLDYWFFYRYNPVTGDRHEGDWEGVTVVLDSGPGASPSVGGAIFWDHGVGFYRANFGTTLQWCPLDASGYTACSTASISSHVADYVASGSHAAYEYRCTSDQCENRAYSILGFNQFENSHDGQDGWSEGVFIDPTPISFIDGREPPAWVKWRGRWGASEGNGIAGESIPSPGKQAPYECTQQGWDCDTAVYGDPLPQFLYSGSRAVVSRRPSILGRCATWYDADLGAFACSPSKLARAEKIGRFKGHASFTIRARGRRGGSGPAFAQVIGGPLRVGARVLLAGKPAADEIVVINIRVKRTEYAIFLTNITMGRQASVQVLLRARRPYAALHGIRARMIVSALHPSKPKG